MHSPIWITCYVLNVTLIVMTIWLIVTTVMYGQRSGRFRRSSKTDYNGGLIFKFALAASIFIIPRLINSQVVAWIGFDVGRTGDLECEVAVDVSFGTFYASLLPVYLFLWTRQKCLFAQPSIKQLYTLPIKIISWSSLIFLIIAKTAMVIIFIIPNSYQSSESGCRLRDEVQQNVMVALIIGAGILLIGQVTLVGLFIYPLHHHRKTHALMATSFEKRNVLNEKTSVSSTLKKSTTSSRLVKVMWRSVVCALICIVSDLTALLSVAFLLPNETPTFYKNTLIDLGLAVNVLSLMFSFDTYKRIIKATCFGHAKTQRSLSSAGSQSFHLRNKNSDSKLSTKK